MFHPSKQAQYCTGTRNALRCIESTLAPTLAELAQAYGKQQAQLWVMAQVYDLSESAGCRDKVTDKACNEAATFILTEYPTLKVTELMLFFWRSKFGDFGRFYGTADIQQFGGWMRKFNVYVNRLIGESERQRNGYYR